jgi:adenine-specific DNA-methyltransferase
MGEPNREGANPGRLTAPPALDPSSAIALAATLAEANRLDFARQFLELVVTAYWAILYPDEAIPDLRLQLRASEGAALTADARSVAHRIAAGLASLPLPAAADTIGMLYATLLPQAYKAQYGIYYTPPALVGCLLAMAEDAGIDWRTVQVLDPACGAGAFLIAVADRMMQALEGANPAIILRSIGARLSGFELDPFGAWLAQMMVSIALRPLSRAARCHTPELVEIRDSLDLRSREANRFGLVIGNPPYGCVGLSPLRRQRFARSIYGHANLYGVFTDAALHWAKPGGVIAYVTPTSMLSGQYFKALRILLAQEAPPLAVNLVSRRGGVFSGVLQETMLAAFRKEGPPVAGKVGFIDVATDGTVVTRDAGSFTLPERSDAPWLLPRSVHQRMLTRRLRAMPYRLKDYGYGVSTGPLVWNRFKDQFRSDPGTDTFPVIWAEAVTSDGRFIWRSEKRNHFPWFAAKRPRDDWMIVTRPCVLLQRTTAKEQPRRLIAAELPESFIRRYGGVLVENHLNMIRAIHPNPAIPAAVIAVLLNSAVLDGAFRCINGSVAVSAFELEELPLPAPLVIERLVRLITAGAPSAKVEATIAAAYGRNNAAAIA